jgi:hypothetical protein
VRRQGLEPRTRGLREGSCAALSALPAQKKQSCARKATGARSAHGFRSTNRSTRRLSARALPATLRERWVLAPEGQWCAVAGRVRQCWRLASRYTDQVSDDQQSAGQAPGDDQAAPLPEHLSALVGSLDGPPDLGRNHDKYLSYADRDDADSAASA